MKCPVCGIEMMRRTRTVWVCRNKKCVKYQAKTKGESK